jgi:hypothetical protein
MPAPPYGNSSRGYSNQCNASEPLKHIGIEFNPQGSQNRSNVLDSTRHRGHEIQGNEPIHQPKSSKLDNGEVYFSKSAYHPATVRSNAQPPTAETIDREYNKASAAKNVSAESKQGSVIGFQASIDPRMLQTNLTLLDGSDGRLSLVEEQINCTTGPAMPDRPVAYVGTELNHCRSQIPSALVERWVGELHKHFNEKTTTTTKNIAVSSGLDDANRTTAGAAVGSQVSVTFCGAEDFTTIKGKGEVQKKRKSKEGEALVRNKKAHRERVVDETGRIRLLACPFCKFRPAMYHNCLSRQL